MQREGGLVCQAIIKFSLVQHILLYPGTHNPIDGKSNKYYYHHSNHRVKKRRRHRAACVSHPNNNNTTTALLFSFSLFFQRTIYYVKLAKKNGECRGYNVGSVISKGTLHIELEQAGWLYIISIITILRWLVVHRLFKWKLGFTSGSHYVCTLISLVTLLSFSQNPRE